MSFNFNKKDNFGFTLVEMLIYVALMTLITLVIVQALIVVLKSNRGSFAEVNLRNSGYSAMEGMLREIYSSESIDQVSGGILQMKQNSGANIVKFATSSSSVLNFYEGAGTPILVGPLTSKNILVKSLIFTQINTGKSLAVRIQMKLETTVNEQTKGEWFYGTAILRGSY
ncbi:MAG: prepilin-type N-terminal cleavage/methylation domain-containing protein [bacterium]